jgi:N utilization substance protein B
MLNRRQLRIKVLQILYAYYQSEHREMKDFEKQLFFSIDKMYEMYLYLLLLVVEMQGRAIDKIEAGLQKKLPAQEDLHPNTKFVTNTLMRALANSKNLTKALETTNVSWADNQDLIKRVFRELIETEDYKAYMADDQRGFEHDKEFLLRFFKRHMINVEGISEYFEEKSIFWNDDMDLMAGMVIKTIKIIPENAKDIELLTLWKDKDDEHGFTTELFRQTIIQGEDNAKLISEAAANWDMERIAITDMILMKMAIAEAKTMESIPLKVTLNEYIELAKYYSTPKSNGFINGVLDQLFAKLNDEKGIKKVGRGLIT